MQAELYFIVPKNLPLKTIETWDSIRDEVGEAIGNEGDDRWLTIAFTANPDGLSHRQRRSAPTGFCGGWRMSSTPMCAIFTPPTAY